MHLARTLVAALVIGTFSVSACHSHRGEGPAERAGQKIDSGTQKLGEKMEEGGQKLQDKARGD
jgi:predicted small secreted protein